MTNGNNIPASLPPIKRCRDYHLYDYAGNRYLDLYLDGGRALMGHKPGKTMLPLKNSLEKGIWAPYPSVYEARLEKLIARLFPAYPNRAFFANRERMEISLGKEILGRTAEWLPLTEQEAPYLIVRPLIPGIDQTHIVLAAEPLPRGDTLSPVLLEGIIRNFHDFEQFREKLDTSLWTLFDRMPDWKRNGPTLEYRGQADYSLLVERALQSKVLLPARKEQPVFLPSILSAHEIKLLSELFSPTEGD